ncbi:MAG: methylated-DNA--[protein]-cysteine S-methyltransferase [Candidatus Cyclobacteriaceae bacterium M3_2C_046]
MALAYFQSPIGLLAINGNDKEIKSIRFSDEFYMPPSATIPVEVAQCLVQLKDYFDGKRNGFSLNLNITGSEFQREVWRLLQQIRYGETWSYRDLAKKLGNPDAIRAVGKANASNPVAIVIPCHRVVGTNGDLIGYAGGLDKKKWLLDHENAIMPNRQLNLF